MVRVLTPEMNAIRVWMRETLDRTGWTPQKWAQLAGTSATNITRFLKDGHHLPSTSTIAKLARVAGSAPPLPKAGGAAPAVFTLPVFTSLAHLRRRSAEPNRVSVMRTIYPIGPEAIGFEVQADSNLACGVVAGDRIVAEPAHVLRPNDGDMVIYGLDGADWHVGQLVAGVPWSLVAGQMQAVPMGAVLAVGVELVRRLR